MHDNVSDKYTALKVVEKDHLHLSSYPRIFEEQLVGQRLFDCSWALRLEASFQDNEYFYFLSVSVNQRFTMGFQFNVLFVGM